MIYLIIFLVITIICYSIGWNSISEPIIRINIGADGNLVNEIVGLMNVIINRKYN